MSLRWRLLGVTWAVGFFFALATAFAYYAAQRDHYLAGIDSTLMAGAQMARLFVGVDFHDRLVDGDSLDPESYRAIVARHNAAAVAAGFQYLWSNLFLPDGRIVFTTATSPGKDVSAGDHAGFFTPHSDPAAFEAVRQSEQPTFSSFHNEWGDGRMVLLPFRDAQGRLYVFGASMSLEPIEQRLVMVFGWALLLFAGLFIAATLAAHWISRSMIAPLHQLERTTEAIAEGNYVNSPASGGGKEIESLSASISRMSETIQNALRSLEESEERFRTVFDQSPVPILVFDSRSGSVIDANPPAWESYGLDSLAALQARDIWLEPPYSGVEAMEWIARAAAGTPQAFEWKSRAADGRVFWEQISLRPIVLGGVERVLAVAVDLTARKQAERLLERERNFLHVLISTLPDLVWLKDPDGAYLACNRRFEQFLGLCEQEILGRTDHQLFAPAVADAFRENDLLAIARGRPSINEEEIVFASDGHREMLETIKAPLFDAQGKLTGVLGIGRDITERKQAQAELEQHRNRLSELVEARTAELEAANKRLRLSDERLNATLNMSRQKARLGEDELLQMGLEEAVRLTGSDIGYLHFVNADQNTIQLYAWSENTLKYCTTVHESHYPVSEAGIWADSVRLRQPVCHNDYQHMPDRLGYPEGHAHLTRHLGVPVMEGERVVLLLGVGNKATDYDQNDADELLLIGHDLWGLVKQRRTEHALAQATQDAEAANRAKSAFLANMSHEIRTPLNAIIGFAQILAHDSGLAPRQLAQADTIARSGEHLLGLINDILDLSKIEAGRLHLNPVDFSLHGLLDDLTRMFALRAEAKGLQLRLERHSGLPDRVHGDEGKLRQVLINLLGNAVKFTKTGSVVLRAFPAQGDGLPESEGELCPDPDVLWFEVEDSGPGMSAEDQALLFQPFQQAEAGRVSGGGTGLGLSISHKLLELMNGSIEVRSRRGEGSLFRFRLPLPASGAALAPDRTLPGDASAWRLPAGTPAPRVLVVDDLADNRQLLADMLTPAGFEIVLAADGAEAVACFEQQPADLVLMDMRMPVMDGFEATRRIKARRPDTPVVAVTASALEEERQSILDCGVDEYLSKPVDRGRLKQTLWRMLSLPGAAATPAGAAPASLVPEPAQVRAALPSAVRVRMREALEQGDMRHLESLLAEAAVSAPELVECLSRLASEFEYDQLHTLLSGPSDEETA